MSWYNFNLQNIFCLFQKNFFAILVTWYPHTVANAQAVFRYNMALMQTLLGDFKRALEILSSIEQNGAEIPVQALMLGLYLQLQIGAYSLMDFF